MEGVVKPHGAQTANSVTVEFLLCRVVKHLYQLRHEGVVGQFAYTTENQLAGILIFVSHQLQGCFLHTVNTFAPAVTNGNCNLTAYERALVIDQSQHELGDLRILQLIRQCFDATLEGIGMFLVLECAEVVSNLAVLGSKQFARGSRNSLAAHLR